VLCVFPRYTPSFGTFEHAYRLMGVKAFMPPQGILLIAACLPELWDVRFIDENIRAAGEADFAWAEIVLVSGMHIQRGAIQDIARRAKLAHGQKPTAVVFGCGDSRVAAELLFDQGLGDMFVVRTAGHVIDNAVLGSIEYAVSILNVPLIVVLGHDSCGAVQAAINAVDESQVPGGYVRDIVERVTPSILMGRHAGLTRVDEFEAKHVKETAERLNHRSGAIAERIAEGNLAIVGVTYQLSDGKVVLRDYLGDIGES